MFDETDCRQYLRWNNQEKLKWNWVLVVASSICAPFRFSRWKHDFVKYWSITRVSQYASNTILQFEKQILSRSPVIPQRLFYSKLAPQHNNIGIALVVVPQSRKWFRFVSVLASLQTFDLSLHRDSAFHSHPSLFLSRILAIPNKPPM